MKMYTLLRRVQQCRSDNAGIAVVEFAIIAPTFMLMLMAFFDFAHSLWAKSVINGALQKAARDNGLNRTLGMQATIDQRVFDIIQTTNGDLVKVAEVRDPVTKQLVVLGSNQVRFTRQYYKNFSAASKKEHEPFGDSENLVAGPGGATWVKDNICNHGEPYNDINLNSTWDPDGAGVGQGGAQDDVIYTVEVNYPRLFPLHGFLGWDRNVNVTSSTILENQPWNKQNTYRLRTAGYDKNCPA